MVMALVLAGCASLSEDECRTADWAAIGYADGAAGRPGSRLADHREACAEYGIAPVLESYLVGRNKGLLEYCRPARGYAEGLDGRTYRGVCPSHLEEDVVAAHRVGREIHRLEEEADDLEEEIAGIDGELADLRQQRARLKTRTLAGDTLKARTEALIGLDDLNDEARRLDRRRDHLDDRLKGLEDRVERLRRRAAPWRDEP